jgi:hypothetical protein
VALLLAAVLVLAESAVLGATLAALAFLSFSISLFLAATIYRSRRRR